MPGTVSDSVITTLIGCVQLESEISLINQLKLEMSCAYEILDLYGILFRFRSYRVSCHLLGYASQTNQ